MKVDWARFAEDFDVALVVLSRDRAELLKQRTDTILRDYLLFYSGDGYEEETYNCREKFEVPRGLRGLSVVRNYVLDKLSQRVVIFVDDDLNAIYWVSGTKSIRLGPDEVQLAMLDLVVHALDQGSLVFGMGPNDLRKSSPLQPFRLRAVFGTVLGVIGRDLHFDERNVLKTDYDFCLMAMKQARTVHLDMRYFASSDKDVASGGNMEFRSSERRLRELENLMNWWGEDVIVPGEGKGVETLAVHVP